MLDRILWWLGYEFSPLDGEELRWKFDRTPHVSDPKMFEMLRSYQSEINRQFAQENQFRPYYEKENGSAS
jgi:hypothetical protein